MGRSGRHGQVHGGVGRKPRRGAESGGARQIKIHDALTGAALVVLALVVLWHIQSFPAMPGQKFGPAWFPGLIAAGLGICGALLVYGGLRERTAWVAVGDWIRSRRARAGIAALIVGLVVYIVVVDKVGFHLTGIALLAVWLRMLGASWRVTAIVAVVATLAIHLAFYKALRVPLPWGVLERWAF